MGELKSAIALKGAQKELTQAQLQIYKLENRISELEGLQRELDELRARSAFVDEEIRKVVNSDDFDICSNTASKLSSIYLSDGANIKSLMETRVLEKCLPPVMTLTTIPVACREPADYMIGFNRCRNEIKRNLESGGKQATQEEDAL